jgi:hypothetical protein
MRYLKKVSLDRGLVVHLTEPMCDPFDLVTDVLGAVTGILIMLSLLIIILASSRFGSVAVVQIDPLYSQFLQMRGH